MEKIEKFKSELLDNIFWVYFSVYPFLSIRKRYIILIDYKENFYIKHEI